MFLLKHLYVIQIVFRRIGVCIYIQYESMKKLKRNKRSILFSDHKTNSNLIVLSSLEQNPANTTQLELLQGIVFHCLFIY